MNTRIWVRCLAWWGSPCVAWSEGHQEHAFAFWQQTTDSELLELLEVVKSEHADAEEIEPGYSADCDFNVKYIRIAWAS